MLSSIFLIFFTLSRCQMPRFGTFFTKKLRSRHGDGAERLAGFLPIRRVPVVAASHASWSPLSLTDVGSFNLHML